MQPLLAKTKCVRHFQTALNSSECGPYTNEEKCENSKYASMYAEDKLKINKPFFICGESAASALYRIAKASCLAKRQCTPPPAVLYICIFVTQNGGASGEEDLNLLSYIFFKHSSK